MEGSFGRSKMVWIDLISMVFLEEIDCMFVRMELIIGVY